MKDYLEEGSDSTLLEALDRMDGTLKLLKRLKTESVAQTEEAGGLSEHREALVWETDLEGTVWTGDLMRVQGERNGSTLQNAVETAERRQVGTAALEMPRRRDSELGLQKSGVQNSDGAGRRKGGTVPDLDMTVQKVDRIFQRDSRRYDGGFFLY